MQSWNATSTEHIRKLIGDLNTLGWYHSIELPNGEVIQGIQSVEQQRLRVRQFPIPTDLRGKRVLDIGAWDGWFSFEMEKRGASVVAVDAVRNEKLLQAREMLGSKIEYHIGDICELRPSDLGVFDIVLYLGVLYHVKNPVLSLERVCALSTDLVCVESFVIDDGSDLNARPILEFYETTELGGQFDNWVGPNVSCMLAMCRTAGFARVKFESVLDSRAHVTCHRKWPLGSQVSAAPRIVSIENAVSLDLNFSAVKDEYISLWFMNDSPDLKEDDVFPEVGPFGSRPVSVENVGPDGWHTTFKLPPGLEPGWAPVRVRVRDSLYSNEIRIGMDAGADELRRRTDPTTSEFHIDGVTDGKTWEANRVRTGKDACISLWVRGLPAGAVFVRIGGRDLPNVYVSEIDAKGLRQVNALIPSGLALGSAAVNVVAGDAVTAPVSVEFVR